MAPEFVGLNQSRRAIIFEVYPALIWKIHFTLLYLAKYSICLDGRHMNPIDISEKNMAYVEMKFVQVQLPRGKLLIF